MDKSNKSDMSLSERVSFTDLSITDSGIVSNSSTVKSLSLTVPCVSETLSNIKLLGNNVRPHSLDLSYQSERTYSKTSAESLLNTASSTTNSLPLPPRRRKSKIYSLYDAPPPRHLLGPKPSKFRTLNIHSNLTSECPESKLLIEITPILNVIQHVAVSQECRELPKDDDDNVSLDDVFVETVESDAQAEIEMDLVCLEDGQIKFIDDISPESTDVETLQSNIDNIDSDVESQKSILIERSDTDSQVDIQSESSLDTVATVIGKRDRIATVDSTDALDLPNDNMLIIQNPSYKPLNVYELLGSDGKLSAVDEPNPKLAKDLKNKMSKDSTHRLSKNLATEITDFFKTSASKLKPSCLEQAKKDILSKKLKVECDLVEPSSKTPQRLIPRSPYIAPVPIFEHKVSPRKTTSTKQPPFYVWNINSKNAAVCTTRNPSTNYRIAANDECKTLKDVENSTRKIIEISKRSNGNSGPHTTPAKTTAMDTKSASTGQLAAKALRESKMSHAQSNDLKPKPFLYSSKNKIVTKHRPSPNRLQVPKPLPRHYSPVKPTNVKAFKFPTKTIPKINIPLPSPRISITKIKTQLPFDFPACQNTTLINNIDKSNVATFEINFSNITVSTETVTKKSWLKKWRSVIHDLFRKHQVEFYIDGVPPCNNFKRSNTWPPKTIQNVDDPSIYLSFK